MELSTVVDELSAIASDPNPIRRYKRFKEYCSTNNLDYSQALHLLATYTESSTNEGVGYEQ